MKPEWLIYCGFAVTLFVLSANNVRHLVLPDKITIPAILAGLLASWLFPSLHGESDNWLSLIASAAGAIAGGGSMYILKTVGKALFGSRRIALPENSKVVFSTHGIILPEAEIPYEDIFYHNSDKIETQATFVDLIQIAGEAALANRDIRDVAVTLSPELLTIGNQSYDPDRVLRVELYTTEVSLPREAVGFGLVKLAGLIGAFLGWQGVLFALACGVLASTNTAGLMRSTERIEAATPICVGALVWITMGTHMLLASILAVVCGTGVSLILHRFNMQKGGS